MLGVVQGLTEFLPVSSSGHLVLARQLLPYEISRPMAFDIMLHFGTLVSVLWYFRRDLAEMVTGLAGGPEAAGSRKTVVMLGLATLPVAAVGGFFSDALEATFSSPVAVGVALLGTALLLFWGARSPVGNRATAQLGPFDALVIGFFQAAALMPGISRAGATISSGLRRGLEREAAARFAFLLSVPAIAGAILKKSSDLSSLVESDATAVGLGTLAAALTGWVAIDLMMRTVRGGRLLPFAVYCLVAGSVTLLTGVL